MMQNIAAVAVDNNSKAVDRLFDYLIPNDLNEVVGMGARVIVPFGNGNKKLEGYIIDIKPYTNDCQYKIKCIYDVIEEETFLDKEMLDIASFLKKKYKCTLIDAIKTIIPSCVTLKEKIYISKNEHREIFEIKEKYQRVLKILDNYSNIEFRKLSSMLNNTLSRADIFNMDKLGLIDLKIEMRSSSRQKLVEVYIAVDIYNCKEFINKFSQKYKRQTEILKCIIENKDELTITQLCDKYKCSSSVVKALCDKGLLDKQNKQHIRNANNNFYKYEKMQLNAEQVKALSDIKFGFKKGKYVSLIHGVTGSGKTEIYLNLVEDFINKDMGTIALVPEISLTPQTVERFKGRFGDTVAVLHSRLSDGEKFDEWNKIKSGNVKVVIGARSAVFAPIRNLRLIIIDEEHEYSYKSETTPKYLTKEVAEYRIKRNNGLLIMGSATPSLESYYKAQMGNYNLINIKNRANKRPLPEVSIVDMREELKSGNRSVFSSELMQSIEHNLTMKKQTILFLNRRGYSTFVSCRECGYVLKCNSCDVSLTYHSSGNKLSCHYCGMEASVPNTCPSCGSKYIRYFGSGTEKIEAEISKLFPQASVIRMDLDTTRKKGQYEELYNKFKEHKADILIGTQMISKGMDFKDVTLVGVIAADITLNLPDFRSAERTFQLLTQVAGRAGRGKDIGKVIIQSYDTEHYSIQFASKHDYNNFYAHEIDIRRKMNLPPFSDILYVLITSDNENELIRHCMDLKRTIKKFNFKQADVTVLGPTPCYISKVKNNYRWHMMLKGDVTQYYDELNELIFNYFKGSSINYSMDINPYNMF